MNREDIIRMAEQASAIHYWHLSILERFAALVAAAERESWPAEMEAMERQVNILTDALAQAKAEEREACAAICDTTPPYPFRPSIEAAHAIRARKENT